MAGSKSHPVGHMLDGLPERVEVERPDGTRVTVTGGQYVLSQTGTYRVGDQEVKVSDSE